MTVEAPTPSILGIFSVVAGIRRHHAIAGDGAAAWLALRLLLVSIDGAVELALCLLLPDLGFLQDLWLLSWLPAPDSSSVLLLASTRAGTLLRSTCNPCFAAGILRRPRVLGFGRITEGDPGRTNNR
jgi:hypothetical protein